MTKKANIKRDLRDMMRREASRRAVEVAFTKHHTSLTLTEVLEETKAVCGEIESRLESKGVPNEANPAETRKSN